MKKQGPLLKVRFDGHAVGPGTVPVTQLVRFLYRMNTAFQRVGRVLQGESASQRRGRPPKSVEDDVNLELVSLEPGSSAAVLGFERIRPDPQLPGMDTGEETLQKAIHGLKAVQGEGDTGPLPAGYDAGVLMAWRDAGNVLGQGIERVSFALGTRNSATGASLTPDGLARIRERIQRPQSNVRTVEGRLLMADFKEQGTRCRVHPSAGEPVLCQFDDSHRDQVLGSILGYVRVVGKTTEDPATGRITSIRIHDIEPLDDKTEEGIELLPKGTAVGPSFWAAPTLDELADLQNVKPLDTAQKLFGTWPGERNDGFEATIIELRNTRTGAGSLS